jgi:hypothetical protein
MAASFMSRTTARALETLTRTNPRIEVRLHDQPDAAVPSFTSLDTITGDVIITADADFRFDQVTISLIGEIYNSNRVGIESIF